MNATSPEQQILFLTNLQRILDDGSFSATYKYALLLALADLSIEKGGDDGASLELQTEEIAEKFIELYWRQIAPYPSAETAPQVLQQNTGRQAAIMRHLEQAQREITGSLGRARHSRQWPRVVRKVDRLLREMPLWRLQTIGSTSPKPLEFLYENQPAAGTVTSIELLPGVATHFRTFYPLVRNLVEGAWVRFVRRLPANQTILGQTVDLYEFLFGSERESLGTFRPLLRDLQSGQCFYCGRSCDAAADVDHFIPWARYPLNATFNLVAAHASCNRAKSDWLAAAPHLERWQHRNREHEKALASAAAESGTAASYQACRHIARWAYTQAEASKSEVWVERSKLVPLDQGWRVYLSW